jgi:hypothetical protein
MQRRKGRIGPPRSRSGGHHEQHLANLLRRLVDGFEIAFEVPNLALLRDGHISAFQNDGANRYL